MSPLIGFINYICDQHLEAAGAEILRVSRQVKLPLLKPFSHLQEAELWAATIKRLKDMAESLTKGTYLEEQKELIRQIETTKLGGISKEDFTQVDLTMIFAVRRIAFRKFLPLYTKDVELVVEIMNDLEQMHVELQELAYDVLFRA